MSQKTILMPDQRERLLFYLWGDYNVPQIMRDTLKVTRDSEGLYARWSQEGHPDCYSEISWSRWNFLMENNDPKTSPWRYQPGEEIPIEATWVFEGF